VPSVPTPLAGAVYVLHRERVHIIDVPFTKAISSISRWGYGSKDLVAAMSLTDRRMGGPSGPGPANPSIQGSRGSMNVNGG
jgi:hypothetical protein